MARTLAAFALVAALVAPTWLRLEAGPLPVLELVLMAALALVPALVVALGRRRAVVAGAAVASTLVAASAAFEVSLTEARPGRDHDFFGPVLSSFRQGSLDFFDTKIPFDPAAHPEMHGVVLFAAFGFLAAAGLAIAARRTFLALAALLLGAGWPATMASTWLEESRPLVTGALILAASLALLVLLRSSSRSLVQAGAVGVALVAASVGFSTSDAVAKRGFVDWDSWDFYDRPDDPVDVSYVWDSNYDGIKFPKEKTVVLKVKVPGPRRSFYWRATTLDRYTGDAWREALDIVDVVDGEETIEVSDADPLLPEAAADEENWVRQEVRIEALKDTRLVASAQVARWEPSSPAAAALASNGGVAVGAPPPRGHTYTAWSYAPPAKPKELSGAGTDYPSAAEDYLRAFPSDDLEPLPAFGTPGREEYMRELFADAVFQGGDAHRRLWNTARSVTADADSAYAAVVMLEAWFRGEEGGFTYDESPPVSTEPPLVAFLQHKRGYCQQFAGAMALMLRYLGVPARVAAGFTSGVYDENTEEWTVTDHNAHTWVEVYFPRFGWVPFDPTPDRGQLSAAYTPFSTAFDARDARALGGALLQVPEIAGQVEGAGARGGEAPTPGAGGPGGGVPETIADTGRGILAMVVLIVGGAALALVAVKQVRRRLRFAARDPRALAGAYRRDLVGFLVDQGYDVPPSATLAELGELVERAFAVNAGPFVGAVAEARYGPPGTARNRVRRARAELGALRRRMSGQLRFGQRLRGALSLRSLTA